MTSNLSMPVDWDNCSNSQSWAVILYSQPSEGTTGEIVSVSYMYIQVGKGEDLNKEFRIHHTLTGRHSESWANMSWQN